MPLFFFSQLSSETFVPEITPTLSVAINISYRVGCLIALSNFSLFVQTTGAPASSLSVTRAPEAEDDELEGSLEDSLMPADDPSPGASSMSVTEGSAGQQIMMTEKEEIDAHICGQCRAEFMGLTAFLMHKKNCSKRPIVLPVALFPGASADPPIAKSEDAIRQTVDQVVDKDPLSETRAGEPLLRSPFATRQIGALSGAGSPATSSASSRSDDEGDDDEDECLTSSPNKQAASNEWPATSDLGASVVLTRRLQNTNVAVAQQLAPSHAESGGAAVGIPPKTLQATLTSLQQHQLMLMSVIHQMQAQLATTGQEAPHNLPFPLPFLLQQAANMPTVGGLPVALNPESQAMNEVARSASLSPASRSPPHRHHRQSLHHRSLRGVSSSPPRRDAAASKAASASGSVVVRQESHKSPLSSVTGSGDLGAAAAAVTVESDNIILSPGTGNNASSSTTNNRESVNPEKVQPESGPGAESPLNTLELLQLHTEKALQNTMSGSSFLVNGISGLGGPDFLKFRKDGKEDPSYRHRCRYCGKVFGSDSALQIHIRSHTGERPFKCNICGNRFSTKGNLKVHFQRHKAKYPHVKMNPNPVPEHLDKFHPPLEPPSGSQSPSRSDSSPPPHASSSTAPPSYAGLFGHAAASSFEGMRNAFQGDRDFTTARSRLGSFFNQLEAAKSASSATKDQMKSRSPPMQSLQDLSRLSAVSYTHSNDASNMSMTEESDRESEAGKREGDRVSSRKRPSDTTDAPAEISKEDEASNGGSERSGPQESKRDKRSSESFFQKDRQIKQEKSAGDDDDDDEDDALSGEDEKPAVRNGGRNGQNHRSTDRDSDLEDSSNAGSSTGNRDEDESDGQSNQSAGATVARFSGHASSFHNYFPAGLFPGSLAGMLPPGFSMPPGMHPDRGPVVVDPNAPPGVLATDPHLYQDLLPKPGSNDNAWESLMEIQKASETTKLQHLVDNIENKMTDPNECIICHRVLSCKSALQMHYRTHTGERPFKCKLCSRAFTTKGNLKTHMGVHRVKPPLRILHQCPVCHKQFTNALVLQQHIRMHTGEPTDIPPEHIMANEIKHSSQLLPSFHRHPIGLSPYGHLPPVSQAAVNPFFAQLMNSHFGQQLHQQQQHRRLNSGTIDLSGRKDNDRDSPKNQKPDSDGKEGNPDRSSVSTVTSDKESHSLTPHLPQSPPQQSPPPPIKMQLAIASDDNRNPFSVSLTALEKHVKTITTVDPITSPAALTDATKLPAIHETLGRSKASVPGASHQSDGSLIKEAARSSSRNQTVSPASVNSRDATSIDGSASMNADDQRFSPASGSRMADENSRTMDSVAGNGALDLTPRGSSRGQSPMSVGSVRGLPSPGMIRPPHMFPPLFAGLPFPTGKSSTTCRICMKTFACNSALEIHYRSHTKERPFKCDVCDRGFSTKGNMKQHMLTHKIRDLPPNLYTTTTTTASTTAAPLAITFHQQPRTPSIADSNSQTSVTMSLTEVENGGRKDEANGMRSPESRGGSDRRSSGSSPGARRSSSHVSKHVCSVCLKPFSSHSALQIHMRTHTGDKPFKCTICGRAFTTKGNLKVHMGMYQQLMKISCQLHECLYLFPA